MTINNPQVKRRDLLKAGVAASAAMTVGIPLSEVAKAAVQSSEGAIVWTKGVCRFCGTGCGLQVGVKDGRVVATKGDPDAPVNKGLNCIKGYFNAKILYGKDRLTQPLMRRTNGKFDKNGKFEAVTWDEALTEMANQFKRVYKEKGPTGVAILGSGQYTIPEAYAASKLVKPVGVLTTLTRMPVFVWRALWLVFTRYLVSTSRLTTTPTLKNATQWFCGAITWPRLIRFFGLALLTAS